MSSRAFGILIFVAQALWTMTVPAALAQDKPPAASNPVNREVIAVVPRSWPPQYDLDENGNPVGFAIDVMNEIAARAGVRVTYRVLENFAAVEQAMRDGQGDIIPNSGITPERAARYSFTAPVETTAISIVVRAETTGIGNLSDLAGRHVGILETNVGEMITEPYKNIQRVLYKDAVSALFELLSGRIDALIHAPTVIMVLARKAGVEDRITTVGEPVMEIKRAIRVRKDRPELLAALDDAVEDFVGTPGYQRIYVKWYGRAMPFWTERRIAWAAGGVFAALLLIFALWRYRWVVQMNRRIAASEEKFRDLIEGAVPGVLIHRDHRPLFANQSYARIFGYDSAEELLRQESALDHVAPHDRARLKSYAATRLLGLEVPAVYEFQGVRKDGSLIWLENRGRVVDWEGAPAIQRTVVDITEKKMAEAALMLRSSQQAVVAELGQQALVDRDLMALMNTAVKLVAKFLETDLCGLLELPPGGDKLVMRAGFGWKPGLVGKATVDAGKSSQAGYTLSRKEPVVVTDWRTETRFGTMPPILRDHGVVSGITVIIGDPDRPFGVLSAHTISPRLFSEDDVLFLKTIAIMLASAIARKRTDDALRASADRLRGAIESLQEGFVMFDAEDRVVMINDVYRRINPNAQQFLEKRANFEDLIRANVQRGIIADAAGREEAFIRERLEQHRKPKGSTIRRHTDGRWYIIKETRTPEGGTAITLTDISDLKRAEGALRDSREQLRAVIDASPSAITVKDREGRILLVNRAFADWMAAKAEDVVGRTLQDLFPVEGEKLAAIDKTVLTTGKITTTEISIRYGDGRTRDVLLTKGPIRSAAGDIVAVCTIVTDVTDLKRAGRALSETQQRFQIVVDNLPMGINVKDRDGRYMLVNKQFEEWYGLSAKDIVGKRPEEISDGLKALTPRRNAHQKAVIDSKSVVSRDEKIKRPDGTVHNVEVTKFPVFDDNGEVTMVGTIATDVTERKRAEQKLAELHAELAHVSRVSTMGEMAASLAHELNQPLTAITNYAKGTLRRLHAGGGDTVDLLPIMELVAEQALRAGDIIRKIRGFMNRSEPQKTRIDLHKTIDEVIALLAGEINMSGIEVAVEVPKSLPPVMADSIQVQQVLLNLIRNAVSAMDGDGANHHRLEVGARAEAAGDVEIYVKDNGPGVPADIVGRLFEPFFTTKTDGLGMGLSISRSIVTSHQGRIWFSSGGGEGATFHFTLPTGTGGRHDAP